MLIYQFENYTLNIFVVKYSSHLALWHQSHKCLPRSIPNDFSDLMGIETINL